MQDIEVDPRVSLTLSLAEVNNPNCVFGQPAGGPFAIYSDPESPACSRLTISGVFMNVSETAEASAARQALFAKHPAMPNWAVGASDHSWFIGKIAIQSLWLIDFFGGAQDLNASQYFGASPPARTPSTPGGGSWSTTDKPSQKQPTSDSPSAAQYQLTQYLDGSCRTVAKYSAPNPMAVAAEDLPSAPSSCNGTCFAGCDPTLRHSARLPLSV